MRLDKVLKLAAEFEEKPIVLARKWAEENIKDPHGNCFFYASVISILYPGLKLIMGQHSGQHEKDTAHFWLENEDGVIFDPTTKQLSNGEYSKGRMVDPLKNIGYIVEDPMFKELTEKEQNYILSLI